MIDKTAIIHPNAKIASNVEIGAFSVVGEKVEIASGTSIGSHVVIDGPTKIGTDNKIFSFSSIGAEPQHKHYNGEDTSLIIGNGNVIREFCSIHRGTMQGHEKTIIGDNNYLMNYVHIAHDCILGNNITCANNTSLAGHVTVKDYANFGGFAKVLQYCTIGQYCFISGSSDIVKDVPPYVLVAGSLDLIKVYGLNIVGLRRNGFSEQTIKNLEKAYKIIYRSNLLITQVLVELEKILNECPEVYNFIEIIQNTKKGIVR